MNKPSALWRASSVPVIALTGVLSRLFLYGFQRTSVEGLDQFLQILKARRTHKDRGLLTVSNHKSVIDDPVIWGTLPFRYMFSPSNTRHSLGSADICFTNRAIGTFFALGQVHPTYRLHKSAPLGGLFQPTLPHLVSLLSAKNPSPYLLEVPTPQSSDANQWIHIFPEGRVHQHPTSQMRYFKWGASRFLLEPKVQPLFVPMFIDGPDQIMHESRRFPRFLPRIGKKVKVVYGAPVPDSLFHDVRAEWALLVAKHGVRQEEYGKEGATTVEETAALRTGKEAIELRIETTKRVREEIVKLRRRLGYPEEEEDAGEVETYREGAMAKRKGKLPDGTWETDVV